jgi:hypothetical protein
MGWSGLRTRRTLAAVAVMGLTMLPGCVGASFSFSSNGGDVACVNVVYVNVACTPVGPPRGW